jgi:hypothetical protein
MARHIGSRGGLSAGMVSLALVDSGGMGSLLPNSQAEASRNAR